MGVATRPGTTPVVSGTFSTCCSVTWPGGHFMSRFKNPYPVSGLNRTLTGVATTALSGLCCQPSALLSSTGRRVSLCVAMGTLDHMLRLELLVGFPSFPFPPGYCWSPAGHPRIPQLSLPGSEVVQPPLLLLCGCPALAAALRRRPPGPAAPWGASAAAAEQLAGSRQL